MEKSWNFVSLKKWEPCLVFDAKALAGWQLVGEYCCQKSRNAGVVI